MVSAIDTASKSLIGDLSNAELAFFGGSFTAIDREYMTELLNSAQPYIKAGLSGIRISTRPDCIDDEILTLLKDKGVTAIELGAQSMDEDVLIANRRGHTPQDVIKSSKLIKEYGFSLGLQMMTGLYKSSIEKDIKTARQLAELMPDTMRIYPTVVIKNTALAVLYERGEYQPYDVEKSVDLCAKLLSFFNSKKIKVIRLGLHDSESLKSDYIAGAYHPALRELCESRLFLNAVLKYIKDNDINSKLLTIYVNPSDVSRMIGQSRKNIKALNDIGYEIKVIQDREIEQFTLCVGYSDTTKGQLTGAIKIFGDTGI